MGSVTDGLYSRQSKLTLLHYDTALVVGCGGIGNWVAMDLALSGRVSKLILIDPDTVEESNLNRTFYDYTDIGQFKVDCLAKHIEIRRPEQQIDIMTEYMDDHVAQQFIKKYLNGDNSYYHSDVCIIDCRDDIYEDCYPIRCKLYKVGYDGMNVSIDGNPRLTKVFGQRGGSYSVVPSYIGSAQLAAILVCNDLLYPKYCKYLDSNLSDIKDQLENYVGVDNVDLYNKQELIKLLQDNMSNSEDYPYLDKRVCYEHDEFGRLNDVINMDCTKIIPTMYPDRHAYVIPNKNNFDNLPNLN